ncbi:RfaL Lipid A core - O-antigen ligase and related enzymes [Candidatus Nanopelagicaceae bacterium]
MFNRAAEKTASNLILVGAPFTSLFIVLSSVTDPVNATKLVIAGGLGFGLAGLFLGFNLRQNLKNFRWYLLLCLSLLIATISAALNSDSPLSQNIYGSYGRNTGLVAYLALVFISLGALNLREAQNFKKIIYGLQIVGAINVIYCAWVLAFGDFLSWSNPYGNILGLFGNPNFIGAFLGMFIASLMATSADPKATWKYRVGALLVGTLAFYEVLESNAIQGIVVTAGGAAIVGFFIVRSKIKTITATYLYVIGAGSVGLLALLGALQKGPLDFVYKTSVSLRGAYWNAGITMGKEHPWTGVGMDSYGDWYRRTRSEQAATILPGPRTVTNAAHNVVIDFFAFGGWPLLLSYLGMLTLASIAIIRVLRRGRNYDVTFVALATTWACYQAQSLISINQIGLAIWGWLLTAALISYEFATRKPQLNLEVSKAGKIGKIASAKTSSGVFSPQLIAGIGIVVGLIVASPPMSADTKWRTALKSGQGDIVLKALEPSYLNPSNSQRFAQGVQLFANSNLVNEARQVALAGIEFNPEYFDAWRVLYFLPNSTEEEKNEALANMKRLDPRNPDVLAN